MVQKYDIFISYRRTAFEAANLLSTHLKSMGYSVFFDLEEMNQGKFNEQIIDHIKACKDFIIVLPANALDRCSIEEDWVRKEILCAIENGKNIIPLMLEGFVWPNPMPKGLETLCLYQAVMPVPITYYESQVKKVRSYLLSKPSKRYKKALYIVAGIVLVLAIALFGIEEIIYRPTADKIARSFTAKMQCIDKTAYALHNTEQHWETFLNLMQNNSNQRQKDSIITDMQKWLKEDSAWIERNIITSKHIGLKISPVQSLLLSWRGIETNEVEVFGQYEEEFYFLAQVANQEYNLACLTYKDKEQFNSHRYGAEFKTKQSIGLAEVMAYGYQYDLCLLTNKAQTYYYKMAYNWKYLPMRETLNLTMTESLTLQEQAINKIETAIITYEVKMTELKNN